MVDACGVDILQTSEDLVKEKLNMVVRKGLIRLNNLSQVSFHQLRYHINLVEVLSALRFENSFNTKNIFMV